MTQPALLVDCFKIISWLQQRRKLNKDWYNYQKAAQQKIKLLLKDHQQYADSGNDDLLPYIKENSENFNYCDVVNVANMLLKTKWAENKNLVFGYGDKRIKQWQSLKKFMENKQVSIINVAKFINQGLSFDLPSLNKSIEMLDNQMKNLKRKIDFNCNTIYQQEKQSQNERNKMGFKCSEAAKNLSISEQIPNLIKELPQIFQQLEKETKNIGRFYEIYKKYCQSCGSKEGSTLQMLQIFLKFGNQIVENIKEGNIIKTQYTDQQKYSSFLLWKPFDQWGIQILGSEIQKNNDKKQTLLEKRATRIELVEDLNQLLYFYQGLKYQQSIKSKLSALQSEKAIQLVESELEQVIKILSKLIAEITGKITVRIQLKNNEKAYQLLIRKFGNYEQNISQIKKQNMQYESQIEQMRDKRQEIVQELRKLRARLVQSKNECQKYLTDFIKREIRIIGQINKLE